MTLATGIGSMPGDDADAFLQATRVVLERLPDLPHLVEVPGRGATAQMTGRALAVVSGLAADLQPAGWRLTGTGGGSGVDHRRARSLLAQDLDVLEEETDGYTGAFKIQVTGPWTLASTVEKPRGDKVLSDHGARLDLAQALAEGVRTHVRDVRRRLPGVDRLVVQVDEPGLASVLGGKVPTASGWGRHRTVHPPEASDALGWVLGAITDEGAEPWVHSCAPGTPLALLRGAGARGLAVDVAQLGAADHDVLAEALEAGESVVLGVVPSTDAAGASMPGEGQVVEAVTRWLDMLGLDPASIGGSLAVSPTCGLAGASERWSRRVLALLRASAAELT
ncbi:methionine synthase [Nocardioides sp. KIGAM211]|uniref:Methionine synthase n=1 Tax=Nocardioides luti TaxID=2761101 RepID=A0A7X0RG49_9ACTN|nr:methionine synthase [Nocardioides luti]MBB6626690.1 methionine synthase [Nocardioides luti]